MPASPAHGDAPRLPGVLVSLHLPKTAGTGFGALLREAFGISLREDYAAPPMQFAPRQRQWRAVRDGWRLRGAWPPGLRAVHGHFLPVHYRVALAGRPAHFITWLREPVERLVSHYHYWRHDYAGDDPAQPLRNRILAEDWSLERFCLGPELRDLYRQYLWGFAPRRFAFIGLTEHYDQDLARFARDWLGRAPAPAERVNAGPPRAALDPALRRAIERHHARDVALYRWAQAQRAVGWPALAPGPGAGPMP
jgi:hypothetical protein